jgi:quercetin dioxygenase-like cupin family protein
MEIDRMKLASGARLAGVPHMPGTQEYLYCERGSIVLWVSGDKLELKAGDVASFAGEQRHSYANNGKAPAIGFSVVTLGPIAA